MVARAQLGLTRPGPGLQPDPPGPRPRPHPLGLGSRHWLSLPRSSVASPRLASHSHPNPRRRGDGSPPAATLLIRRRGAQDPPGRILHPGRFRPIRAPPPGRRGPGAVGEAGGFRGDAAGVGRPLPGPALPCNDPSPAPRRPRLAIPRCGGCRPRHLGAGAFVRASRRRVRDRRRRLLVPGTFCRGAR